MAWENKDLSRTLFIQKTGTKGSPRFTIYPMCRVTTPTGTTYLEPLPYEFLANGSRFALNFTGIEFIEGPGIARDAGAGDLALTNFGADYGVLRTDEKV